MYYTLDGILWARRHAGPQCILNNGEVRFSQLDTSSYNRESGPAQVKPNGAMCYKNKSGELHRTNGPAVITSDGKTEYFVNGVPMPLDRFFLMHGVL